MVCVRLEPNDDPQLLCVELRWWERLLALLGDIEVRTDQVVSAVAVDDILRHVRGVRGPGYQLPGHASLGRWRGRGWTDAVASRSGRPGLVLQLTGHRFRRLLVEVPEPGRAVRLAGRLNPAER